MKEKISFSYAKMVFTLALPVMIQQFITAFASLIDNLMVGVNGKDAINAVGASGNIFFVVMLLGYGISNGTGIYIAQQFGSKEFKGMHYTFLVGVIGAVILGLFSSVFVFYNKEFLINLFTRVDSQHLLAYEYLKVAVFTYPIIMVSMSIAGAYRRCGNTFSPMVAGVIAIVINTILNFILINGNFGAPALGVKGAAIATLVARIVELLILVVIMERKHMPFRPKIMDLFSIPFETVKKVVIISVPLTLNEFLWGFGMTTIMALYGYKSADNYTAVQVAYTTANLLFVVMSGFSTAVSVLIGQELGRNDLNGAKVHSKMLNRLSLYTGFAVLVLAMILSFIVPELYNISNSIKSDSANVLRIIALYFPVYTLTSTIFFTLRSGGDVKGVLIVDGVFMWIVAIPMAYVFNKYFGFSLVLTFLIVQSSDVFKLLFIHIRYKKDLWIKKLV